jgi:hypothetical protein
MLTRLERQNELERDVGCDSSRGESGAKSSQGIPVEEHTSPQASLTPMDPPPAWPDPDGWGSGVRAVEPMCLAEDSAAAGCAEESLGCIEQAVLHDTIPSPPPQPDDVA